MWQKKYYHLRSKFTQRKYADELIILNERILGISTIKKISVRFNLNYVLITSMFIMHLYI